MVASGLTWMGNLATGSTWMGYLGALLLCVGGAAALAMLLVHQDSPLRRSWARYQAALEKELRFLFMDQTGANVARTQLLGAGLVLAGAWVLDAWLVLVALPIIAVSPWLVLQQRHVERVLALEKQLDGWLLLLANALKATPSLGEALEATVKISQPPMQQEVDLVLKETCLGTPLDEALLLMSRRIRSRTVSGALATILVGRQTGGDLPRILAEGAAALREMERLEGVVRAKTAEGKGQAAVLAAVPFVIVLGIHSMDPTWLQPLMETPTGWALVAVAGALWVAALVLARRILAVDI